MAYRCCDERNFKEFRRWDPKGFQAAITTGGRHGGRRKVAQVRGDVWLVRDYLMDFTDVMAKYGV